MEMDDLVFGEAEKFNREKLIYFKIFGVIELLKSLILKDEGFNFIDSLFGVPEGGTAQDQISVKVTMGDLCNGGLAA